MKKFFSLFLIILLFFYFLNYLYALKKIKNLDKFYNNEIIVKYKENLTTSDIKIFSEKYFLKTYDKKGIIETIEKVYNLKRKKTYDNIPLIVYKVDLAKVNDIIKKLNKEEVIEYAEYNYKRYALYTPYTSPNDIYYQNGKLWGFNKVEADKAYNNSLIDINTKKNIIVAVIDTGVNYFHEDLKGVTVNGINIINKSLPPLDDGEDMYHGTFVAGIIAANTNNNLGICGTGYINTSFTSYPKINIMPVKVLDSKGEGSDADIYSGVKWAVDNGAKILNMSFGGPSESLTLENAINYATSNNCIVVAAAGNDNTDTYYPAKYSDVISVGATNSLDKKAWFSNTGKIDVVAPGVSIYSCGNTNNSYVSAEGTSFAAPFVSALASLLMIKYDNLTPIEIRTIIEQTTDDVESAGYDNLTGWGRINVYKALSESYNEPEEIKTYNWPNPFSPETDKYTNITFILKEKKDVVIKIYDAAGYLVWQKEITKNNLFNGYYQIVKWDGKNSSNKKVGNGVYFYTVKAGEYLGKNKIVIIY